jgi:hypothetical protein
MAMLTWYLARGAGIAAFAALSLATGAGAMASRRTGALERRVLVQYVHRSAALTGVALLVLHICTVIADSYAKVGVSGAFIPFASGYRALAVTFGVLAMYLMVAVSLTGVLRSRFARSAGGSRVWRSIHLAGYAAWAGAAWHFVKAGSDAGQWWALLVLYSGIAVVVAGLLYRISEVPVARTEAPVAAGVR